MVLSDCLCKWPNIFTGYVNTMHAYGPHKAVNLFIQKHFLCFDVLIITITVSKKSNGTKKKNEDKQTNTRTCATEREKKSPPRNSFPRLYLFPGISFEDIFGARLTGWHFSASAHAI